jgi:glycosyltransferase involved in cell wall biosynthesis
MKPAVCFGMTLHNNAKYLPEAIESLLNQSYGDFYLVAINDCSSDETEEIMRGYQKKDKRISYFNNEKWSGLISTWRRAFHKAFELHRPSYFAWASDHDIWHRDWLEYHVRTLNKYTNVVLSYPETVPISEKGKILEMPDEIPFETMKMSRIERMYSLCNRLRGSGNKVYGLFRTEPLIKAGVFRYLPMPDRLLLVEIGLYGPFKMIREKLWQRRYVKPLTNGNTFLEKQNSYIFGPGKITTNANYPYFTHTLSLALSLGFFRKPDIDFNTGLLLSLMYLEANYEKIISKELERFPKYSKLKTNNDEHKSYETITILINLLYGQIAEDNKDLINVIVGELIQSNNELGMCKNAIDSKSIERFAYLNNNGRRTNIFQSLQKYLRIA